MTMTAVSFHERPAVLSFGGPTMAVATFEGPVVTFKGTAVIFKESAAFFEGMAMVLSFRYPGRPVVMDLIDQRHP